MAALDIDENMAALDIDEGVVQNSNLSDSLLRIILSLLPLKEAVRTSTLSKQWKHQWKYVHRLDIDPKQMIPKPYEEYLMEFKPKGNFSLYLCKYRELEDKILCSIPLIDGILVSHKSKLRSCGITHFPNSCKFGQVNEWIEFLKEEKGIHELTLTCEASILFQRLGSITEENFNLMPRMFACRTLRVLELNQYVLKDASPFEGCVNLGTLTLNNVRMSDKTLVRVVFNCRFLEKLSLCSCPGLENLKICDQDLRVLELRQLFLKEIEIHAKGLNVLLLFDMFPCSSEQIVPTKHIVINTPNLTVFKANCKSLTSYPLGVDIMFKDKCKSLTSYPTTVDILERCCGLWKCDNTSSKGYDNPIEKLKVLSTSLDLRNMREQLIIATIFQVCVSLQELYISNLVVNNIGLSQSSELPYFESEFWNRRELSDSISRCLKIVCITGFRGSDQEIQFVSHLITKAPMLDRIVIQCDDNCPRHEATATLGLLLKPRASINVSIVLKPGPKYVPKFGEDFESWVSTL